MRRLVVGLVCVILVAGCGASAPDPVSAPGPVSAPAPVPAVTEPPVITATFVTTNRTNSGLFFVSFADAQHGWRSAGATLLATADGGRTWRPVHTFAEPLLTFQLLTATLGWAVTPDGLHATQDGGKTWTGVTAAIDRNSRFQFVNAQTSVLTGRGGFGRSTDGGRTWSPLSGPCTPVLLAHFVTPDLGFAACAIGSGAGVVWKDLYRTDDGGQTWRQIATTGKPPNPTGNLPFGSYLTEIFFLDADHGWLGDVKGGLDVTNDGGRTWAVTVPGQDIAVGQIRFFTPARGLLVLSDRNRMRSTLVETQDGGATWAPVYPFGPADPSSAKLADAGLWAAVGTVTNPGTVLMRHEYDGAWEQVATLPGRAAASAFSFVGRQYGWVAVQRQLFHTVDGGKTWSEAAALDVPFTQLDFVDAQTGFSASFHGPLRVTHDGGRTFDLLPIRPDFMRFVSPNLGWVIVDGKLKASTDGGATWRDLPQPPATALSFDLLSNGTALLLAGTPGDPDLFFTADGGDHWTSIDIPVAEIHPQIVKLGSGGQGWLWDSEGRLYTSADQFRTWTLTE